jgi:hypothetical protein
MTTKSVIENWASDDYKIIACDDFTKCGACWKEKLRSDVAKEFLKEGRVSNADLAPLCDEVDRLYKETPIYKEVMSMLGGGKSIDEIEQIMSAKGISI